MTNVLLFDPESQIGILSDSRVSTASAKINDQSSSSSPIQVGHYILIRGGNKAIFGMISALTMQSDGPSASLELIATINLGDSRVTPGVGTTPPVGSPVFKASGDTVSDIMASVSGSEGQHLKLMLGRLQHSSASQLNFTPERLFGRHLAIIGTSGSGKSWSVARLLGECGRLPASKAILLDATGEYHTLEEGVKHVQLGGEVEEGGKELPVSLPYYHLNESDLFGIINPHGQSQAAKLRAAIDSLKIAKLADYLAPDGTIIKAHKSKIDLMAESQKFRKELEDPRALFDITMLPYQIRHECIDPQQSPTEPMYWGGHNSIDYSYCVPMIDRIQDIINSPSLAPIFSPAGYRSLFDEINLFLKDSRFRLLRVSLKYLSFAYNAREILVNSIGRYIMDRARMGAFKKRPLLLAIDEAHQFLNNNLVTDQETYKLDSFALIAKEGRKYAVNIAIATQRPRDIPEDVLSQMGSILVHRLINDRDRFIVERACGELDARTAAAIPVMASGQAALIGVDFPIPIYLNVEPPQEKPDSAGPDFQSYWT